MGDPDWRFLNIIDRVVYALICIQSQEGKGERGTRVNYILELCALQCIPIRCIWQGYRPYQFDERVDAGEIQKMFQRKE